MTKLTTTRSESRARYFIREKAQKRGWLVAHPSSGGQFLEENEIAAYLPKIGLDKQRPDFLMLLQGLPVAVIEAKNSIDKLDLAVQEACEYADQISQKGAYNIRLAIGAAGEEDTGFEVGVYFRDPHGTWSALSSRGVALSAIPSIAEIELALASDDGTTTVGTPSQSEFIDAAVELSMLLREAKVEAPLRPKVIGTLVSALYQSAARAPTPKSLAAMNALLRQMIYGSADLPASKRQRLYDALELSGADFNRLTPFLGRIIGILNRLNVRAVMQTDTDFLGMFYEAFLRYGYDNNALGIVFTPRHITQYCVQLTNIEPTHTVIDIASGTGGFLVAAFDAMNQKSKSVSQRESIREALAGFDTNPTIWALASLNMFFRGDGKSHIENASCLDVASKALVRRRFDRAYLNPPFSQDGEPETLFMDTALEALKPGGFLATVVLAGVFTDDDRRAWRERFLRSHRVLAVISLPEDLFYPTAAPTSILIAQAHVPHGQHDVFLARIWNDGFEKLKNKRVSCAGEQLTEIADAFGQFQAGAPVRSPLAHTLPSHLLAQGQEWSPQQWLPQPPLAAFALEQAQQNVVHSLFCAAMQLGGLPSQALGDFTQAWAHQPPLPLAHTAPLSFFFSIGNGKSAGEKNFGEGDVPYISSGDTNNSIVRLVQPTHEHELFPDGAITMTAFGQANLQPWPFLARGNGGSSVRVLTPRFRMSVRELVWFTAQINSQRWRFFYLRQAIKSRLSSPYFQVTSPPQNMPDQAPGLAPRLLQFKDYLNDCSQL